MEYFDEDIGNEFHEDFDQSIPEGFEWNAMKSGIQDKMDNKPKRKRRFLIWYLFAFGVLSAGMIYLLTDNQPVDTALVNNNEKNIQAIESNDNIQANKSSSLTQTSQDDAKQENAKLENSNAKNSQQAAQVELLAKTSPSPNLSRQHDHPADQRKQNTNNIKNSIAFHQKTNGLTSIQENPFNNIEIENKVDHIIESNSPDNIALPQTNSSPSTEMATTAHQKNNVDNMLNNNSKLHSHTYSLSNACDQLPPCLFQLFSINHQPSITYRSLDIPKTTNKISKAGTIGISGGLSLWNSKYKGGALATKRNAHTTAVTGFHIKANKEIPLSNQLDVNIGFGYEELYDQFEAMVIQEEQKEFTNALLRSHTSLITGRVTETRGDTLVKSDEVRTVRHYNSFKTVSLDVTLAKKWNISTKSKFTWNLGPCLSILTQATGKTLGKDDVIIEYGSSNQIFKSSHWAAFTGFAYEYNISRRCNLQAGASIKKYFSDLTKDKELKLNPTVYQFSLGLNIKI